MFNLFSKKKEVFEIKAPFAGKVIPIEEVKDDIFAGLMMGDGVAIEPIEGEVCSPINGVVSATAVTYHALGITGDNGEEIVVHFGLETVKHKGQGFQMLVKQDDRISCGQLLLKADINYFKEKNVDLTSPIVLTNSDKFDIVDKPSIGKTVCKGDVLYIIKRK